ncbi:hypothetical protein JCM19302_2830 [Jejuia pallidilutea]|uniref:Uncharacterized protein n=1 Tax=Jejuia pallidilutea TaxID=504487 RepID=A0A090W6D0_9FLAO|nr:hypothetical protein JCM19302_2830 [Jejuia pallidilutea]
MVYGFKTSAFGNRIGGLAMAYALKTKAFMVKSNIVTHSLFIL